MQSFLQGKINLNKSKSYILVLTAAFLWGILGTFFRKLSALGFSPMEVTLMRLFVAAVLLSIVILLKDRGRFRIRLKDLWCPVLGGFFTAGMFLCYFTALTYTTVAVAGVLLYTAPGFVVIFSALFFKERITVEKVIALILLILGCMCSGGLVGGALSVTTRGLLWGIMSGLTYALYSVFNRFTLNRGYGGLTATFYTMLFGSIIAMFLVDPPEMVVKLTPEGIFWGVGIGFVCCMLPYLVYTLGMKQIETGEAAMLATAEPVVAALVSVIVLHEPMTAYVVMGVMLIVMGILAMNIPLGRFKGKFLRRR